MIFKGTDGFQSFEFAPSSEQGTFLIATFKGEKLDRPIEAPTISISGIKYSLGKRLEEGDPDALEVIGKEHLTPVEGQEATYQLISGLYVCANLVEPRRSIMGGFDTFTESPAPDIESITLGPEFTNPAQ
jgi:hypothetical protein